MLTELVDNAQEVDVETRSTWQAEQVKVARLRELGFEMVARKLEKPEWRLAKVREAGYRVITQEQVEKFLERKVELYNREQACLSVSAIRQARGQAKADYEPEIEVLENDYQQEKKALLAGSAVAADRMQEIRNLQSELVARQRNVGQQAESLTTVPAEVWNSPPVRTGRPACARLRDARGQAEADRPYSLAEQLLFDSPNVQNFVWWKTGFASVTSSGERIIRRTVHYNGGGEIGQYAWVEIRIEKYKSIPPQAALNALKVAKEKKIFDYFTIGSVEGIKDPLLLGRINGLTDRGFIAQWDADVCLDDLV
jgi:chemotaxis protein histidine kinase CheA